MYDFLIVLVTYVVLILTTAKVFSGAGTLTTILRVFRVGRVVRLAKKAKRIKLVMFTLVETWPTLSALCFLLIIFIFVFSVIGCSLFGKAKIGEPQVELNVHANFQTFSDSFMTLLRCFTGENWDSIMYDLARGYSITFQCNESESYEDIQANGGEPFTCGNTLQSFVFFISF